MRLLVRSLGGPVPTEVKVDQNTTLGALLESGELGDIAGDRPRLVYRGQVLRDPAARLRDLLVDGDTLVALPSRAVVRRPTPPGPPSKGPTLREINAAIRESLAAQGPATLAAAEAAAAEAANAAPAAAAQLPSAEALEAALLRGEMSALRGYLEHLQEALQGTVGEAARGDGGAGGAAAAAAGELPSFAAAFEALLAAMPPGGAADAAAAVGHAAQAADEDEGSEEEGGEEDEDEGHTEEEEEEHEAYTDEEEEYTDDDEEGEEEEEEEEEGGFDEEEAAQGPDGQLLPPQVPELNSQALAALTDMGFSEELCRNALLRGRNRFEPALEWLLAHADDPHAANPLSEAELARVFGRGPPRGGVSPDPGHLAQLQDMGFAREQAEQALRLCHNSLPAAASWLLSGGAAAAPAGGAGQQVQQAAQQQEEDSEGVDGTDEDWATDSGSSAGEGSTDGGSEGGDSEADEAGAAVAPGLMWEGSDASASEADGSQASGEQAAAQRAGSDDMPQLQEASNGSEGEEEAPPL
ncbi:ubiquitin carboxyl-terminal hydrolase 5 isoform X2 [Micractinium conductrix]|uniref:Ubiquitin carboxyl-terminal hydrolase 5 isoform X2 n=1 Tax=Micractinium conductrix TaxID=554055 RepID=A0A2P6VPS6_9CHLO|nr:ubiquitin carboxyl-terminal hydrolase 5 isoform X2 [Micractinium conductrix]|eukprot:PSC76079.1 ubiquitin carboxyl-terminal hydrolase 5 isoform X2 [Micractinium conductrix]